MKLLNTAFLYFNKIKVVHSIKGRIRLSVPGLNKVPAEMQKYDHYTTDIIKMQKGVKSVEYSYITSKILITYGSCGTRTQKLWLLGSRAQAQ